MRQLGRLTALIVLLLGICLSASAQTHTSPNLDSNNSSTGPFGPFTGLNQFASGAIMGPTTFAGLSSGNFASAVDGTWTWVTDGTAGYPCTGGGTGSWAGRQGGIWVCMGTVPFAGTPTGSCLASQTAIDLATSNFYFCQLGNWAPIASVVGSAAWSAITAGTNLNSLLMGNGGSLAPAPSSTGTITANLATGTQIAQTGVDINTLFQVTTTHLTAPLPLNQGGLGSATFTIQGTDSKLMTAGTISGTSAALCTDANGGATTLLCPNGGGPGTGTQYYLPYWGTTSSLGSVGSPVTGAMPMFQNGSAPTAVTPSLTDSSSSPVITSNYTIQCDSPTTVIDRGHTIRFQSPAATPIVPLSSSTSPNCVGLVTKLLNDGAGSLVFSRTSPDTFTVLNGGTNADLQTSFTLTNGQYATLSQSANGIWEVLINVQGSGTPVGSQYAMEYNAGSGVFGGVRPPANGYVVGNGSGSAPSASGVNSQVILSAAGDLGGAVNTALINGNNPGASVYVQLSSNNAPWSTNPCTGYTTGGGHIYFNEVNINIDLPIIDCDKLKFSGSARGETTFTADSTFHTNYPAIGWYPYSPVDAGDKNSGLCFGTGRQITIGYSNGSGGCTAGTSPLVSFTGNPSSVAGYSVGICPSSASSCNPANTTFIGTISDADECGGCSSNTITATTAYLIQPVRGPVSAPSTANSYYNFVLVAAMFRVGVRNSGCNGSTYCQAYNEFIDHVELECSDNPNTTGNASDLHLGYQNIYGQEGVGYDYIISRDCGWSNVDIETAGAADSGPYNHLYSLGVGLAGSGSKNLAIKIWNPGEIKGVFGDSLVGNSASSPAQVQIVNYNPLNNIAFIGGFHCEHAVDCFQLGETTNYPWSTSGGGVQGIKLFGLGGTSAGSLTNLVHILAVSGANASDSTEIGVLSPYSDEVALVDDNTSYSSGTGNNLNTYNIGASQFYGLTVQKNLTVDGQIIFPGSTSGSASIDVAAAAGSPSTLLLPQTDPTQGQSLIAGNPGGGKMQSSWGNPTVPGCTSACSFVLTQENITGVNVGNAAVVTAEQIHFMGFYNLSAKLLAGTGVACIDISTLFSGGHADVGVFSLSGTTLTRIWHTGGLSTTSTGQVCGTSITSISIAANTFYYIGFCMDNGTSIVGNIAPGVGATATANSTVVGGSGAPAHTFGVDSTDTCSAGVLPSSATSTNIVNSTTNVQVPLVAIFN